MSAMENKPKIRKITALNEMTGEVIHRYDIIIGNKQYICNASSDDKAREAFKIIKGKRAEVPFDNGVPYKQEYILL